MFIDEDSDYPEWSGQFLEQDRQHSVLSFIPQKWILSPVKVWRDQTYIWTQWGQTHVNLVELSYHWHEGLDLHSGRNYSSAWSLAAAAAYFSPCSIKGWLDHHHSTEVNSHGIRGVSILTINVSVHSTQITGRLMHQKCVPVLQLTITLPYPITISLAHQPKGWSDLPDRHLQAVRFWIHLHVSLGSDMLAESFPSALKPYSSWSWLFSSASLRVTPV